jgi:tetratricopeptide (TPR) repeat protein
LDENYLKALLRRAKCYMELGDFDDAVRDYERALKMDDSQGKIPPRSKGERSNFVGDDSEGSNVVKNTPTSPLLGRSRRVPAVVSAT